MCVMVTFVGLLIFIFSLGYMQADANFKQFFCFLSLFAAAMLGVLVANSLLLLFICWELVGLASYLLIGFWFHKPSAAAAAKKALSPPASVISASCSVSCGYMMRPARCYFMMVAKAY